MTKIYYGQTPDPQSDYEDSVGGSVELSFDEAPFSVVMSQLSESLGMPIVWGTGTEEFLVSGVFSGVSPMAVLVAIGRRYNFNVSQYDGIVFIGNRDDLSQVTCVIRFPASEEDVTALSSVLSSAGKLSRLGPSLLISDGLPFVRQFLHTIDDLKRMKLKGYIAELFFVSCTRSDLLSLQLNLEAEAIDLFSSGVTLNRLFKATLAFSGESAFSNVKQVPRLYLSEGKEAKMSIGQEVMMSRSSVSAEGYSSVSGYDQFNDGVEITMTAQRVTDGVIALDVDLQVSKFLGDAESGVLPTSQVSQISSPGMLVTDGDTYFLGALETMEKTKGFSFLGLSDSNTDKIVTVWVKIREISLMQRKPT